MLARNVRYTKINIRFIGNDSAVQYLIFLSQVQITGGLTFMIIYQVIKCQKLQKTLQGLLSRHIQWERVNCVMLSSEIMSNHKSEVLH